MLVAYARRDIHPGERLSFCYGDAELMTWEVARRRAHLLEKYGFTCGCERCVREAAAMPGAAKPASAPAEPEAAAATAPAKMTAKRPATVPATVPAKGLAKAPANAPAKAPSASETPSTDEGMSTAAASEMASYATKWPVGLLAAATVVAFAIAGRYYRMASNRQS